MIVTDTIVFVFPLVIVKVALQVPARSRRSTFFDAVHTRFVDDEAVSEVVEPLATETFRVFASDDTVNCERLVVIFFDSRLTVGGVVVDVL